MSLTATKESAATMDSHNFTISHVHIISSNSIPFITYPGNSLGEGIQINSNIYKDQICLEIESYKEIRAKIRWSACVKWYLTRVQSIDSI